MKKNERNGSAETLRKHSQPLTFFVYYMDEMVLRVKCKSDDTVADLITVVKQKLSKRFDNIVGLATVEEYYTLDYTLQMPHYPINNYRNGQKFTILLQQIVNDYSCPTLADFTFLKCLGEGISAAVYLVRHNSNALLYALKQIKKQYFREFKSLEGVLRQKKIMVEITQDLPFTVKLQAAFESYKHLNFLLQFYPGGEMFFHLTFKKLTQQQAKLCFSQILLTMQQLHNRRLIYRDLKPQNIMIDFDGNLRLGDFGMCKINQDKDDLTYTICGSPEYMSPQSKHSKGYSYSVDFYTMGAIIFQMVVGIPPYYQNCPLQYPGDATEGFVDIVSRLIQFDNTKRMSSFTQIKKLKWLRTIDWDKLIKKQYKMPLKLNPYLCYIHDQFKQILIDNAELKQEEKYDRLFDMFFYMLPGKNSLSRFYPYSNHHTKSYKRHTSTSSKDKHTSLSKSKNKEDKHKISFKRKNVQPNIYTHFSIKSIQKIEKGRNDTSSKSSKSLSKSKKPISNHNWLIKSKSPIQFNRITQQKSNQHLRASDYMTYIGRHLQKSKKH